MFNNGKKPSNDNVHTTNGSVIECFRDVKNGRYKSYLYLAQIYEQGHGVKPDMSSALSAYEKYYEAYRKVVPTAFDIVEFLIELGNKFKLQKDKVKAEEYYFNAYLHIVNSCRDNEKKKARLVKKYKLEELIKELN